MQLGEIIRSFSEEAPANEALLACNDIVLFARVGEAAGRYRRDGRRIRGRRGAAFCQSGSERGLARADERDRAGERSRD